MTRVIWTVRSLRNLRSIQAYISRRLKTAGDSLSEFPERGAPISGGRRQLTHIPPYLIRYRVANDLVVILDIRHAAQDLD
jgi:toxin ParE1/3/4